MCIRDRVIGEHSALSIEAAHVTVAISSLLDEDKIVESLVIEGVELAPKDFSLPLQWINQASKAEQVKIEQISFKKVNLKIRELELATFNGKAELNALRQLNSIVLTSIDHVLSVEITPQIGQFNLKLTADHWPLPLNPKIVFEELKASGTCNQEGIKFNQVHGSIYGGQFTANTVLNWSDEMCIRDRNKTNHHHTGTWRQRWFAWIARQRNVQKFKCHHSAKQKI